MPAPPRHPTRILAQKSKTPQNGPLNLIHFSLNSPTPAVEKVAAHCSDAVSKGARVLAGGGRPEGLPEPLQGGNFFAPTVLADATIDM